MIIIIIVYWVTIARQIEIGDFSGLVQLFQGLT